MAPRAGNDIASSGRIVFYERTATVEGEQRIVPGRGAECDRRPDILRESCCLSAKPAADEGTEYGNDETEAVDRLRFAESSAFASRPSSESVPDANPKHKTVRRPTCFMTGLNGMI